VSNAGLSPESTYKPPQTPGEYPTGAYPPNRTAGVAKDKDAAYHARGSLSRLMISSILSVASAILAAESASFTRAFIPYHICQPQSLPRLPESQGIRMFP